VHLSKRSLETIGIILAAAAAGCISDAPTERLVSLTPVASTDAPLSQNTHVALVDENTACVINSHEFLVQCDNRAGSRVGVFGGEGEGPGEFRRPAYIERGPTGTLGVLDLALSRLTIFEPNGIRLSETQLPPVFFPMGPFGTSMMGYYITVPEGIPVPSELDVTSGEILWERPGVHGLAETECGRLGPGLQGPDGGYVFRACQSELVFLPGRDADEATVIRAPTYVPELPNERDVDEYRESLAFMSGGMSMPASAMEPYLDDFREVPKMWFLVPSSLVYDGMGRLWVATTRDRDAFSYLDIYIGMDYDLTVRIRDRLVGYDLMGSTLVALVERSPGPDGIVAKRSIDWYQIDGLASGTR